MAKEVDTKLFVHLENDNIIIILIINRMIFHLDNFQQSFPTVCEDTWRSLRWDIVLFFIGDTFQFLHVLRAGLLILTFNCCHGLLIGFKSGIIDGHGSTITFLSESRWS